MCSKGSLISFFLVLALATCPETKAWACFNGVEGVAAVVIACGGKAVLLLGLCASNAVRLIMRRGTMDVNPERRRDLGRRVEVYWDGDGVYYKGTVIA